MTTESENNDTAITKPGFSLAGSLLSKIDSPADLRKLPIEELPRVCREIREFIIANCSSNPGHFASSMGAVDITVALHYVFDTPDDRIIWDVGHQAYAHKILTGRRDEFCKLRTLGGPSGFPSPKESPYDTFTAGHASNSISAALGMAIADSVTAGMESRKTVALIGDASISGGLAFEGLNNAANNRNNLLIILNDNNMSIDDNVGSLHRYLSHINTSKRYNSFRNKLYRFMRRKGFVGDKGKGLVLRFNNALKSLISGSQNIFEGLNIRYFGPFDGHDVIQLVKTLREIKDMEGPRLLHIHTKKGKGFASAEQDPASWHAPGKFDPLSGKKLKKVSPDDPPLWQEVFGHTLLEMADADRRIVGITAGMSSGTSINLMMEKYPERTFDVGISEGHAVTFAGGLASAGMRPYVAIYSSFLQRAYDNIIHDVAISGLNVTFCIDRAGVVGEDGVTHHGLFDLAYLRCIPGIKVASPMDSATLRSLMALSLETEGPMAIRYPRGKCTDSNLHTPLTPIPLGKGRWLREAEAKHITILSIGPAGKDALRAAEALAEQGIQASVADMIWLKPIDGDILRKAAESEGMITVEDGTLKGGLGTAVAEWLVNNQKNTHLRTLGISDQWVHHATVPQLKSALGYDTEALIKAGREMWAQINKKP